MPEVQHEKPAYEQIADYYKRKILDGELREGAQLPSVRAILGEWEGVNSSLTVQDAIKELKSEGLVYTVRGKGTFVSTRRVKAGPQHRIRSTTFRGAERVEIRGAERIPAPEYVVPLLDLKPRADGVTRVIRREWLTYDLEDVPFMLSVSWHAPDAAEAVPELLSLVPLPGSGVGARVIAERTGREVTWGRSRREARLIKADGREGPLLRLPKRSACLAETYKWGSGKTVLEYGEYILPLGRVIESDMEP